MERTSQDWEQVLGAQVRQLRLRRDQTQTDLAGMAGVSLTALRNLETGSGATINTLIKVLRALGQLDWLARLAPVAAVSPIALLRQRQKAPRQRAYVPRPKHKA